MQFLNSRFLSFTCPSPSRGEGELWVTNWNNLWRTLKKFPKLFFTHVFVWPDLIKKMNTFSLENVFVTEECQVKNCSSLPNLRLCFEKNAVFESTAVSMKFSLQILVISFSCCCLFQSKKNTGSFGLCSYNSWNC